MGLHKRYLAVGQSARDRLFGLTPRISGDDRPLPLNMLISEGGISRCRIAVILISIATLVLGVILSFVPWLDYFILRDLRLWNGSISYSYWQKPGVTRYTKVYIFNVTNPNDFLEKGEKPKLVEVGPFVYREKTNELVGHKVRIPSTMDTSNTRGAIGALLFLTEDWTTGTSHTPEYMEKVNIHFHDNDTVSYQHHKILRFAPELSVDKDQKLVVPNIPLLTVTSFSPNLGSFWFNLLVAGLEMTYKDRAKPFVHITAQELVFGYDDPLVSLAHIFYPKGKRPNSQMGLLLARNGTLDEVSTIYTGLQSMERFGYIDKINGMDRLPHWKNSPCNDIRASEGSFFPPRDITKSDIVHLYDKDLCRILPMKYRKQVYKDNIKADLYTPPSSSFENADANPDNKCYCINEACPPRGLQNISPCQYNAPVFLSFPHFYGADPSLLEPFEGLKPTKEKHETYFIIQPTLGVPLEGFVRVQLNIKVDRAPHISTNNINKFPSTVFPVMWIEEGIQELTPSIWRWMFLATAVGPVAVAVAQYTMIFGGLLTLAYIFVKAYRRFVFSRNSIEIVELGRQTLRRGSHLLVNSSHLLIPVRETSYRILSESGGSTPSPNCGMTDIFEKDYCGNDENESFLGESPPRAATPDTDQSTIERENSFLESEIKTSILNFDEDSS